MAPSSTSEAVTGQESTIRLERDETGVVTLVLDDPQQSANTMNDAFKTSLTAVADRLEAERDSIRGVIVTSAKKTFFAGGDLNELIRVGPEDAESAFQRSMGVKRDLRRIETLGKPVVAALNGATLGGGLELALACHHRVALDAPGSRIGLPESSLGLLPACGGVVRTVRLLGVADALLKVLLEGKQHTPARALEVGLVHEVVDSQEQLLAAARAYVDAHSESAQPWDQKGYRIPGGTPAQAKFAANLPAFPANLAKQTGGAPYPAQRNILAAAVEGSQVDFETAQVIEARYFTELVTGQTTKNMIQAFFFDLQAVNAGASRPERVAERPAAKVAVLGAGMMGAGIAYSCARAGLDVVLKDVSQEAAEKGKEHSEGLVSKALARGRTTEAKGSALLERIRPTADPQDLAGCDVVIEAVFEDPELKHRVFQEIEDVVAPDALLCSNTSTLPISELATGVKRRADFVGMHFFSPVDRMPLVEIIRGQETGDEALARAFDLVRRIRKTPVVVSDSRVFFTSRVIGHFINEGMAMLAEGIEPATVEQAAAQAGYPAKVLSLVDDFTLTLPREIRNRTRQALEAAGQSWSEHPGDVVLDRMVDEFGRTGRSGGAGFYEYDENGKRLRLWPGLREHFARADASAELGELSERLLFVEALDSVRCVEEGVLASVPDANIGSIMGIGFPGWTGGVLQFIDGYAGGPAGFVARARELEQRYGARFAVPDSLSAVAASGGSYQDSVG